MPSDPLVNSSEFLHVIEGYAFERLSMTVPAHGDALLVRDTQKFERTKPILFAKHTSAHQVKDKDNNASTKHQARVSHT